MKALSLIVSVLVFMATGYFLVRDFNFSGEINHIIYMSLLLVLMLICVVGVLINMPLIMRERRKMKVLMYNKFSRKQLKSKKFEIGFETS